VSLRFRNGVLPVRLAVQHEQEVAVLEIHGDDFAGSPVPHLEATRGTETDGRDASRINLGLVVTMVSHPVAAVAVQVAQDGIEHPTCH